MWRIDPTGQGIERIQQFDFSGAESVAVSPDNKLLAAARADGWMQVWEIATGQEVYRASAARTASLAFSNNGYLAAIGYESLVIWNTAGFNVITQSNALQVHRGLFSPEMAQYSALRHCPPREMRFATDEGARHPLHQLQNPLPITAPGL